MTYKEISLGSRDAGPDGEVKKVQQLLNSTGKFNLEEDGIYGTKTDNAVRTFQRANDLTADGIVGQQTWSKLLESDTSHPVLGSQTAEGSATSPVIGDFTDTAPVSSYEDYTARMEAIYDAWSDREPFSYDVQSDPLYQQYKDIYTHQGRLAMLDTMGQAAALTGGYGSTYAQTAGQQEFQNYMQQLSAAVPELYGAAYDRYNAQSDRLLQEYSLAKDMADSAYAKQTDNYNKLTTLLPLGYSPTDDELTAAGMTRPQANTISDHYRSQNAQSTGSNSSYSYTGGSAVNNGNRTKGEIIAMQRQLGVTDDGQWGPVSQAAAMKLWGTTDADNAWIANNKMLQEQYNAAQQKRTMFLSQLESSLNQYIDNGSNKSEINALLTSAYNDGYISYADLSDLKARYVPKGIPY